MKNFLTNEQIETLQAKHWDIVPKGGYINLYPEDFANVGIWEQICDQLNVSYETQSIDILYIAKTINNN
jgi:hypothetical protein